MRVNVFVTSEEGSSQGKLLVLPPTPEASISKEYRTGWRYFVTTTTEDAIFGEIDAVAIEKELAVKGFAVVVPKVPDRR